MTRDEVIKWREDAIADGWSHEPIYGDHEPEETAMRLKRDGFTASVYNRTGKTEGGGSGVFIGSVSVWGPDKLHVAHHNFYSWDLLIRSLEQCDYCNLYPVKTQCVGFAGRCCSNCLPEQRKKQEYRGWCD